MLELSLYPCRIPSTLQTPLPLHHGHAHREPIETALSIRDVHIMVGNPAAIDSGSSSTYPHTGLGYNHTSLFIPIQTLITHFLIYHHSSTYLSSSPTHGFTPKSPQVPTPTAQLASIASLLCSMPPHEAPEEAPHSPSLKRPLTPKSVASPAKKQTKWTPEEDSLIIELRGRGEKWEDISKQLPGRSAISCRLHYQNYLERRSEWDEDKKNRLARLYERCVWFWSVES